MPIRIIDVSREAADRIDAFDSVGAHSVELAHGAGASHAYVLHFDPGGVIGPHPAGFDQLFIVSQGAGWIAGADGVRHPVDTGHAAFVPKGERHAKGSDRGMVAVMLQSDRFARSE